MSASDPTAAELLTAVNAAIYGLLTHKIQSYEFFGVRYTYDSIDDLRKLRNELKKENRETGSRVKLGDFSGTGV